MRLTYKAQDQHGKETGTVWYASTAGCIFPKSDKEEQALKKLAEYEDIELSPEEFKEKSERVLELYEKLKPYADAEEQGLLVRLPCKVGDTVFVITERGIIAKGEVRNFRLFDKLIVDVEYHHFGTWATSRYWGETVFLTREEAEAALKGGQDDGT